MKNVEKWNELVEDFREKNLAQKIRLKSLLKARGDEFNKENLKLLKDVEGNFKVTRTPAGETRYIYNGELFDCYKDYIVAQETGVVDSNARFVAINVAYAKQQRDVVNFLLMSTADRNAYLDLDLEVKDEN